MLVRCTLRPDDHQPSSSRETRQGACPSGDVYANSSARGATARTFPRELLQDRSHSRTTGEVYSEGGKGAQRTAVTFSEWNEETFVYGHFAMVVPTRHAIFPNAWEYLEVRKDKHHF